MPKADRGLNRAGGWVRTMCHPSGVFVILESVPTPSGVGYIVSSLRDFRQDRIILSISEIPILIVS